MAVAVVICSAVAIDPVFGEVFEGMMANVPFVKIFMGMEFLGWFAILAAFYPLIFASSTVAGEVERRTMEILLAQLVSRSRVFLEEFAAISVNLAALWKGLSILALYEEPGSVRVVQWLDRLTPFHYADPSKILVTGKADWGDNVVLVLVATLLLSAALALFRRKHIAA